MDTEPTAVERTIAEDVIEEAINGSLGDDLDVIVNDCTVVARAVVAAIRAMSPQQQADLIDARVYERSRGMYGPKIDERVVGPWVEVQP